MNTIAEVKLWETTIGAVIVEDDRQVASFQYDPDFIHSNIEVAPLMMPLSNSVYSFPSLSHKSFYGLPGLLADSLPDKYGNALIDAWLVRNGRSPEAFNAVERLCYTGLRGMGALEFIPATGPQSTGSSLIDVEKLVKLASEILTHRDSLRTNFTEDGNTGAMSDILRVGTSAGGARAKAVIAWNPNTNEVRSGQIKAEEGFGYWLIKFDGVTNNRDKELVDPEGYGAIEYAYSMMAVDCGIAMSECRLFEEGGRRHFMTRRFDRLPQGEKLHMQSLAAIAHLDFNQAGANGYEQVFNTILKLDLDASTTAEMYRRMIFNIIARNQDDHVKNIAFLMDRRGNWSLSPAFDVTYSFNPSGDWTNSHQMTINGKSDNFEMDDFLACGKSALLKHGQAKAIIAEVKKVVSRWSDYAEKAGVKIEHQEKIQKVLRLNHF
jgi:serine/threonine-protein kinase HipA